MESREALMVLNPSIARTLIKLGYKIKDISPDKQVLNKSIFYFYIEEGIEDNFKRLREQK